MRLHRYWFQFDLKDPDLPSTVGFGCGVTAWTKDDAIALLQRHVFGDQDFVIHSVIEDVDVSSLDADHVLPNMAPPSFRGIWYPLGYLEDSN